VEFASLVKCIAGAKLTAHSFFSPPIHLCTFFAYCPNRILHNRLVVPQDPPQGLTTRSPSRKLRSNFLLRLSNLSTHETSFYMTLYKAAIEQLYAYFTRLPPGITVSCHPCALMSSQSVASIPLRHSVQIGGALFR